MILYVFRCGKFCGVCLGVSVWHENAEIPKSIGFWVVLRKLIAKKSVPPCEVWLFNYTQQRKEEIL